MSVDIDVDRVRYLRYRNPTGICRNAMIIPSQFKPAWWLPGPHLQTLWPHIFRRRENLDCNRERLELPDGDFLDLDWLDGSDATVVVFHGLEGSIDSHYAAGLLKAANANGFRAVLVHFRGCSGEPNRLPRRYHAGDTGDMRYVFEQIRRRFGNEPLYAVGVSLGGNALLKYLGERADRAMVDAAVAISVTFDLNNCAKRLSKGFSQIYQSALMKRLIRAVRDKHGDDWPAPCKNPTATKTFKAFDDAMTAPLHGFSSATDYYTRSSSRQYLKGIAKPTLIIHAVDDPFLSPAGIPKAKELAEPVTLELSPRGGHVGFVSGTIPGRPVYWLDERVRVFLKQCFERKQRSEIRAA